MQHGDRRGRRAALLIVRGVHGAHGAGHQSGIAVSKVRRGRRARHTPCARKPQRCAVLRALRRLEKFSPQHAPDQTIASCPMADMVLLNPWIVRADHARGQQV